MYVSNRRNANVNDHRPGTPLKAIAVILLLSITTVAQAEDISGKWLGTNESTTVYCSIPPSSTGPAELEITQIDNSFSGTFLWMWANPETCIPSPTIDPYLLDIAGTVDGSSFQADVYFPGEGQVGTMTGSVSGNVMNFTFIIPTDEEHDAYPEQLIDTIVTAELTRVLPTITASVTVSSLWPPNHTMVDVGLISATDDGSTTTFIVYSDEDDGASLDASRSLLLRAERAGSGDGRVYLIAITATDALSHASDHCLTVVVPKSQSAKDIASVNEQAIVALSQCPSPVGYFVIEN